MDDFSGARGSKTSVRGLTRDGIGCAYEAFNGNGPVPTKRSRFHSVEGSLNCKEPNTAASGSRPATANSALNADASKDPVVDRAGNTGHATTRMEGGAAQDKVNVLNVPDDDEIQVIEEMKELAQVCVGVVVSVRTETLLRFSNG